MINIYTKAELYNAIHQNYSGDKDFISSVAKKAGGPVLELAAGTGRLAELILDLNLEYTGIDISDEFLTSAKNRYKDRATFLKNDMRQFVLKKEFNFIFIGFNSFLHNLTDEDASHCLTSVQKHLSDNINSKPKLFLMHGDKDTIVSPIHLLESKEYLTSNRIKVKTKLFKNCEHKIPVEGTSLGLNFLRKNLL